MTQTPTWTSGEREAVAKMLNDGASCADIGRSMKLTRNAACGRVWRDKMLRKIIAKRQKPAPKPRRTPAPLPKTPPLRPHAVSVRPVSAKPVARAARAFSPLPPPPPEPPTCTPVELVELSGRICRYPVRSDVDRRGHHLFCGAPVANVGVYCRYHQRLTRTH